MKIVLLLCFLIPITFSGQNFQDTIFKKDTKNIYCTITFLNDNNIFFTNKQGEGQMLSLNLILFYSQAGKRNTANYKPSIRTIDTLATINGELIRQLRAEYIQIMGTAKIFSKKLTIQIDYGQGDDSFDNSDTKLIDGKGKTMTFNSMVDALNFFSLNGFEFIQAYAFSTGGSNVYHYLLRRKQKKQ